MPTLVSRQPGLAARSNGGTALRRQRRSAAAEAAVVPARLSRSLWYAWQPLLQAFGDEWFAVAPPDQRGYNLSDKPVALEAYRPRQLMDDVLGLIDHRHRRATLVAHDDRGRRCGLKRCRRWHGDRLDAPVAINAAHKGHFRFRDPAAHAASARPASSMLSYRQPGIESALAEADGCAALFRLPPHHRPAAG